MEFLWFVVAQQSHIIFYMQQQRIFHYQISIYLTHTFHSKIYYISDKICNVPFTTLPVMTVFKKKKSPPRDQLFYEPHVCK